MIYKIEISEDFENEDSLKIEYMFQVEDITFWTGTAEATTIIFNNAAAINANIPLSVFELGLKEKLEELSAVVVASLETDAPEYASHRVFYILDILREKYDNTLEGDSKEGGSKPGSAFGD